jgi:hypothetical protein
MHPTDPRPTIYVSSKRTHTQLWKSFRNRGQNIISSWIDLEGELDVVTIGRVYWPIWLHEAASVNYLIFYTTHQDSNHAGNMMEIAACLYAGGTVLQVGVSETMKTGSGELADFVYHPRWHRLTSLDEAFRIASSFDPDELQPISPKSVY